MEVAEPDFSVKKIVSRSIRTEYASATIRQATSPKFKRQHRWLERPTMTMRVLLMAEACNPTWTSVPLVGYNFARALSEHPDLQVTLVSHVRNQSALESDAIADTARLVFVNNEWIAKPLFKLGSIVRGGKSLGWTTNMAINWPAYIAFERQAYKTLKEELECGGYDLVHRITPVSPTMPSPMAKWTDVPMLIGPLNGGLPWPSEYPELRKKEREWLVPVRNAYQKLPYYRSSYRRLAGVVAGSRHTATETPLDFSGEKFYMPENGIDPAKFPIADGWTAPTERFRFVSVGRLVPYKGFHLTVAAMARSAALQNCDLTIIGDGPERERLQQLAAELELSDRVRFAGWMPQEELAAELRNSQAFVFPSLREFGGGVVLEAMASGLPSIIVNYGGPAELVTPQTGFALELQHEDALVRELCVSMETLVGDHGMCERMADAALHSVRSQHTWSAKADQMTRIYRQVLGGTSHSERMQPTSSTGASQQLVNV